MEPAFYFFAVCRSMLCMENHFLDLPLLDAWLLFAELYKAGALRSVAKNLLFDCDIHHLIQHRTRAPDKCFLFHTSFVSFCFITTFLIPNPCNATLGMIGGIKLKQFLSCRRMDNCVYTLRYRTMLLQVFVSLLALLCLQTIALGSTL